MKTMFRIYFCRNCKTSLNWRATSISELPKKIATWAQVIEDFGLNCCDNPESDNGQYTCRIFMEIDQ